MCVGIPFILDVIPLVDEPAGVTQEECHTLHVPPAALVLLFIARRIQPSHSLVDRKVEISGTQALIVLHLLGYIFLLVCFIYRAYIYIYIYTKNSSSCDCIEIRTHVINVRRFRGYQLNHRGDLNYCIYFYFRISLLL